MRDRTSPPPLTPRRRIRPKQAARVLTLADLPPPGRRGRWIAQRKARVVTAVETGLLGVEEACRRYELSRAEFQEWRRRYSVDRV
jgi:hypothetical protein